MTDNRSVRPIPKGSIMAQKKEHPTLRAQWLGRELRKLRNGRGMKLAEVAELIGRAEGTISRYELGEYRIPHPDLLEMLDQYDVVDRTERAGFVKLAQDVRQRGWWDGYQPFLGNSFADYIWLEDSALTMRIFGLTFLDGLLQTPETIEALIGNGPQKDDPVQVKRLIQARTLRSEVFREEHNKHFEFLIHEAALEMIIGGKDIRAGQLRKLIEAAEYDRVELRVLPSTASRHVVAGITTGFAYFELADPLPDVVCVETPAGAIYLEAPDIDAFAETYDGLWNEDALSPKESIQHIKSRLKDE
jgi:transcriptional regulator with XRE-family HTH domain